MIKLFKNLFEKKPKITFWSKPNVSTLNQVEPVVPAIQKLPLWFKGIPREETVREQQKTLWEKIQYKGTIKKCPSFVDWFKRGYTISMWADVYIRCYKEPNTDSYSFEYKFPYYKSPYEINVHKDGQYRTFLPTIEKEKQKIVLKLVNPWLCKTPKGYSVYQMPMFYHFSEYFTVLPGIINTDYHHELNLQTVVHKEGEFIIKKGTPLVTYIPFKREEFDFECIKSNEETSKYVEKNELLLASTFEGAYKNEHRRNK